MRPASGATSTRTNAQRIADGVADGFTQPNDQIRITVGGNPFPQPEESENFSYGLVYQPGWLEGLQVELDRFDIEIADTIGTIGDQNILEQRYSGAPQYCEHVDRIAGGFVDDLRNLNTNVGALLVEGWDIAMSLSGVDTGWGVWDFGWDMTKYDTWESTDAVGTRFFEAGCVFGSSRNNNVDLRSTAFASWSRNNWSARWSLQHIDEGKGVANSSPSISADGMYDAGDDIRVLDATLYNDVIGSYAMRMGDLDFAFSLGVSNLFDEDPPFFPETFANDFDPDYRAWSSRFWYGRVQVRFN